MNIKECIDLYDNGAYDLSLLAVYTGKNVKSDKTTHNAYLERMATFKNQFCWDSLQLPAKSAIEQWTHLPTIITVMNRNVWTEQTALTWFTDYMRWLYTSMRLITEHKNNYTLPMVSILMDSVFHVYLEHSFAYFDMCRNLFNMEYIPHTPGPRIMYSDDQLKSLITLLDLEVEALQQDWGEEYVNRIFEYEMDMIRLRLDRTVTIQECIRLCADKRVDYRIFGAYKGQLVQGSEHNVHLWHEEIKKALEEQNMSSLTLPDKISIELWEHKPTILKAMNEHSWTEEESRRHFKSYMKWLYTYVRLTLENRGCVPMFPLLLDYIWRQYVQFSFDFFAMSQQLFHINYIHQLNFFKDFDYKSLPKEQLVGLLKTGLNALEEDWGREYLNSCFAYEAEVIRVHLGQ